jgi:hypothetical protein
MSTRPGFHYRERRELLGKYEYDRLMDWHRRPTKLWWMKRMDAINFTVLSIILLIIIWTALRG